MNDVDLSIWEAANCCESHSIADEVPRESIVALIASYEMEGGCCAETDSVALYQTLTGYAVVHEWSDTTGHG